MYNYLNDAMNINFMYAEQYKICDFSKSNCKINATICGKCYQDPDAVSRKLYEDMSVKFNDVFRNGLSVVTNKTQWYLKFDDKIEHELSMDYIGPSRAWAVKYLNVDDEEKAKIIGDFLLISRTIGGHIFWPAHQVNKQHTINQVRGGNGIFDRIDITLAELKNCYMTGFDGKFLYHEPLYKAFQRYKWFFDLFGTSFYDYISKMKLDMFLYKGDVISLVDSNLKKNIAVPLTNQTVYRPLDYVVYIENCKKMIEVRTEKINKMK